MKKEIISQYKASLKMLMNVIGKCPEDLWADDKYENQYWRIVYHTLYYTSLYLEPALFSPWKNHRANYNNLGMATEEDKPIVIDGIYSKDELMEYIKSIYDNCEILVQNTDMESEKGVDWLKINRLELHLYNIRHMQHHIGQLIERLHQKGIWGIKWEGPQN